jgi:SHS2 domain-containing protein
LDVPHRFFDHTGDVGVRLSAATVPDLFREAALAFTATLIEPERTRTYMRDRVHLNAATLDDLLVEWLTELLYRFEVRNLLPADADLQVNETNDGWELRGQIMSDVFDPDRHPVKVAIKGVTYHQLEVRRTNDGWETSLVFDI